MTLDGYNQTLDGYNQTYDESEISEVATDGIIELGVGLIAFISLFVLVVLVLIYKNVTK